ncbi:MAG: GNAT family N-acetyltransferase [Enhydrobacter sp.]|nr:GNAT family N-acetyltransferase [Enhydrobacter sp.]
MQTDRLRLRPFRASDLKAMHALYGDAENLRYWGMDPSGSVENTRKMMRWHIAAAPRQYTIWAVEEKKSKRIVGMINYFRRDMRERRVEVGWLILPAMQGKGYMTEAGRALLRYLIDTLKVHRVEALIRPENKPSAALAKRLGFRLEGGPLRDRWLVGGQWHDVMIYGLIAGEER